MRAKAKAAMIMRNGRKTQHQDEQDWESGGTHGFAPTPRLRHGASSASSMAQRANRAVACSRLVGQDRLDYCFHCHFHLCTTSSDVPNALSRPAEPMLIEFVEAS